MRIANEEMKNTGELAFKDVTSTKNKLPNRLTFFLFSFLSSLRAMKAHWGCGCKGPHIQGHDTRRDRVTNPMLGRLYMRGKPPVIIL